MELETASVAYAVDPQQRTERAQNAKRAVNIVGYSRKWNCSFALISLFVHPSSVIDRKIIVQPKKANGVAEFVFVGQSANRSSFRLSIKSQARFVPRLERLFNRRLTNLPTNESSLDCRLDAFMSRKLWATE